MSRKTRTLSEHASKELLAGFGIALAREASALTPAEAAAAAQAIGFPVVVKLCGDAIAHKTERGLVRLALGDASAVRAAAAELLAAARPEDGAVSLLVAEMVAGKRELIAGLVRDPQFGPCVLLGLGGILTEALGDVAFASAPLSLADARALIGRLRASHLVTQPFRGEPTGDVTALAELLVALGRVAEQRPDAASVDLSPVLLRARDGRPVAVDALVELASEPVRKHGEAVPAASEVARSDAEVLARLAPLFHPRGVLVAGVSAHPGKFGFV